MVDGPNKTKLTTYLTGAREEAIRGAGNDWASKGKILQLVSDALVKNGPELAAKLGKDSLTADKLKQKLLQSAADMETQGEKLRAGGAALVDVGGTVEAARIAREAMADLTAPAPYESPTYSPGVQPTPEQIRRAAAERSASNDRHRRTRRPGLSLDHPQTTTVVMGWDESAGRSSADGARPLATSSAPRAATMDPLWVHSPGRGTRTRMPCAAARSAAMAPQPGTRATTPGLTRSRPAQSRSWCRVRGRCARRCRRAA